MLIEEAFRRFLGTALPTHGNRIYANTLPAAISAWPVETVGTAGGYSGLTHDGPDGWGEARIQVVSWHTTPLGREQAGDEVRAACHGFRGTMGGVGGVVVKSCKHKLKSDGYQPELKLYARINDFEICYQE